MRKLALAVASMGSQQPLDAQSVSSPKATVHVSTKGNRAVAPSIDMEKLPPTKKLALKFVGFNGNVASLKLEHDELPFYFVSTKDILDLLAIEVWLPLTVIQLWCTCIHRECIRWQSSEVYCILDPFKVSPSQSSEIHHGKTNNNWQLMIICPTKNVIVWMSSLKYDLDAEIKKIVEKAMDIYRMVKGERKRLEYKWIKPTVPLQKGSWECGHYVMRNMLNIVTAKVVDNWEKTFNDPSPFSDEVIDDNRQLWASLFMELYEKRS